MKKIWISILILLILIVIFYLLPMFGIGNVYSSDPYYGESKYSCNTAVIAPDIECQDVPMYQSDCVGIGYTVSDRRSTDGSSIKNCIGNVVTSEVGGE